MPIGAVSVSEQGHNEVLGFSVQRKSKLCDNMINLVNMQLNIAI